MNAIKLLLPGLIAVLCGDLTSCASTTYPEPTPTERAMGTSLQPPAGQALVVMYRRSEGLHSRMIPTPAIIDGERRGVTGVGSFVVVPIAPGKHRVSSGATEASGSSPIRFTAVAGQRYFFRQAKKQFIQGTMLVPAGPALTPAPISGFQDALEQVPEDVAMKEVAQCKQHGTSGDITVKTWP